MDSVGTFFLTAAAGLGALFGGGGDHKGLPQDMRNKIEAHATTTATSSASIACVAAAVAARETSLATAIKTNGTEVQTAYSDRASALATAYAQTDKSAIRKSVKTAWLNFGAALRLAHKDWKSAQQGAWGVFRTAVRACGASAASISDSEHAGADASAGAGSE